MKDVFCIFLPVILCYMYVAITDT